MIALAIERNADLILLDETEARQIAELYLVPKTGVVGILIRAAVEGKITALRPVLSALRQEGGFWISEKLYEDALRAVGE